MTKEQYINYRIKNNIFPVAYNYYITNCDDPKPVEMFNAAFPIFLMKTFNVISWSILWSIYDDKFDLVILQGVNGNEIKIY